MGSTDDNPGEKTIDDLPDEVLEYILSLVSPYKDSDSCKLVSKRWCRTVNSVSYHSKNNLYRSVLNCNIVWERLVPNNIRATVITKRHSHAACYCDSFMYVFGGCTSRFTTFNDLWTLDLSKRNWIRLFTTGSYPSPKACATLCTHNKNLILFGGWTHPPTFPLHQTLKLFNELHIYNITSNKWTVIHTTVTPPSMAGHSATIHGNQMVVFGGYQTSETMFYRSSNSVWCYNLEMECWHQPKTSNPKPKSRYGQSQIFLDDNNLLIMGGCEGPNSILDDVWLLTIKPDTWTWKQIEVQNPQWAAPHIWCHPACRVGDVVVVFSRGSLQHVSRYFFVSSTSDHESDMVDDSIPPEVLARVPSQGQLPYVKDVNVNGHRGTLGKINRPSNEPSSSSSSSSHDPHPSTSQSSRRSNVLLGPKDAGPGPLSNSPRSNMDIQMAAFQDQTTTHRPGPSSKNRMKQLECLKRMEAKYKNTPKEEEPSRKADGDEDPSNPNPGPSGSGNAGTKMNMYVLDISQVLTEKACVSWRPQRSHANAPREKILHSLVLGKGELILFGGVQKNPSVSCFKYASNTTHIITAPRNVV
ncbi:hypothetical protein RUM44_007266 [Polyplax serrata]|uniref:F-box domain-containing protein n=1 Tax=Polyplax serrata TaxID=468196 RepID=A0ABR1B087_POLSC